MSMHDTLPNPTKSVTNKDIIYLACQRIECSGESRELCDNLTRTFISYIENNFDSKRVIESLGIGSKTFYRHIAHPSFREAFNELRPLIVGRSLERVMGISAQADCDSTSLKASTYLLEAYEPETYDAGVRRQKVANDGNWLAQLLSNTAVPKDVIETTLSSDPFAELPQQAVPKIDP